jgi:CBS domain-containing protein
MPIPLTLIRRAEMARLLAMPISQVMSTPAITLPATATIEEAGQRMVKCNVGSIVATDPVSGKLVGLITRSTITRALATLGGTSA